MKLNAALSDRIHSVIPSAPCGVVPSSVGTNANTPSINFEPKPNHMNSRNSSTPPGQRTRWWGKAALLGAALAFFGLNANAQVSAYTFLATTGTYTDIPVGAPAVDLPLVLADTYVSPVQPIGFTFVYD